MKVLITGVAGFIGFHVTKSLLAKNIKVVGIDNLNNHYDLSLKKTRLKEINKYCFKKKIKKNYSFKKIDINEKIKLKNIFKINNFDYVIHLAAEAGVRFSTENPRSNIKSNISGFLEILENCREFKIKHLVYASSSSIYGMHNKNINSEKDQTDYPVSIYGATKKSNELLAFAYSHLFSIPTTGLRFFTVYGPYGRPDMAPYIFTKSILSNKAINIYNYGKMKRDFTYIDDVVDAVLKILFKIPRKKRNYTGSLSNSPHQIYNVGNHNQVSLSKLIKTIEKYCKKKAIKKYLPMQKGDVFSTYSSVAKINNLTNYKPKISIDVGIKKFVDWYNTYSKYVKKY